MNPDRQLFGIIGKVDDVSSLKREWNKRFTEEGIDAFMDSYPTTTGELPERLSEMFHFDRRGYIVGKPLQEAIIPLLDHLDASVWAPTSPRLRGAGKGRVDVIANKSGILTGFAGLDAAKMWGIWLEEEEGSATIE